MFEQPRAAVAAGEKNHRELRTKETWRMILGTPSSVMVVYARQ